MIPERLHCVIPNGACFPERILQLADRLHIAANHRAYFLISERRNVTVCLGEFFNQART